ncbi:hypothetical protein [Flavobacterium sp. HSC-61S13]|uniref:hypothetical protein n=1 Tax=Flavobacterium sp. HSC-61S13 TaxID=2910963 RepID=UPI00209E104E|nr:hypothetical protein [Flavobacterium sp. HSC-61S13]MCP1997404.1 hypothetical protein [Flavobacterium sp. HSC-61S13]
MKNKKTALRSNAVIFMNRSPLQGTPQQSEGNPDYLNNSVVFMNRFPHKGTPQRSEGNPIFIPYFKSELKT